MYELSMINVKLFFGKLGMIISHYKFKNFLKVVYCQSYYIYKSVLVQNPIMWNVAEFKRPNAAA